jgi:hypothetical protein
MKMHFPKDHQTWEGFPEGMMEYEGGNMTKLKLSLVNSCHDKQKSKIENKFYW